MMKKGIIFLFLFLKSIFKNIYLLILGRFKQNIEKQKSTFIHYIRHKNKSQKIYMSN